MPHASDRSGTNLCVDLSAVGNNKDIAHFFRFPEIPHRDSFLWLKGCLVILSVANIPRKKGLFKCWRNRNN